MRGLILILFILFSFILPAGADTLYLKNGGIIEGLVSAENAKTVTLDVGFGTVEFRKNSIERIYKSNSKETEVIYKKWEKKRLQTAKWVQEEKTRKELAPKEVKIQQKNGHILVDVLLNKKITASLIMDTGASFIVLTSDVAKRLGVDSAEKEVGTMQLILSDGRKITAKFVFLQSVIIQGLEANNVEAAVLPEDSADANLKDGLLGMSFLRRFNFRVDSKNSKLILERVP